MHRTRAALTGSLLALLLGGLVGCGGDESSGARGDATSAPSPSSGASSDPTVDPTAGTSSEAPSSPTGPTSAAVSPATGVALSEASSTVNAPAGWEPMPEILSYASSAGKPGGLSSLQLVDSGDISGGASLDSLAQSTLDTLPKGAKAERLPDVDLDGQTFLHVHYTVAGEPRAYDTFTTVRRGRNVGLDFVLLQKDAATNPDLIASVLATFAWTA